MRTNIFCKNKHKNAKIPSEETKTLSDGSSPHPVYMQ